MQPFAGRAAVAGIGMTALTRASGRTELEPAVEACRAACRDAGIEAREVDAVLSYHLNDSVPVTQVARALGMDRLGWHNDLAGGGTQAASILGDAAMLVHAGLARNILIYRALNGRSGKRMNVVSTGPQERFTYGMAGPIPMFAMAATRYLHETGLGERHLHAVVAQSRRNAAANPRALRREPLPYEDYLARPYVCTPLRTVDCWVNPHGGLLSEGYVHGLNNVAQAVRELRGGREVALVTGFGGSYGSAALLAS